MTRFSRVVYADDPVLVLGHAGAERAYGAPLVIVPSGGERPVEPRRVDGTVLHLDPAEDPHQVRGDRNPMLDWAAVKRAISSRWAIGDLDDRWHEHQFLEAVAPELAPPKSALGSAFVHDAPANVRAAVRASVEPLAERAARAGVPLANLERLELARRRARVALGPALVKSRTLCSSEGRLPHTDDDWAREYLRYVTRTRAEIERLQVEVEGSSDTLESRIKGLPHVEGRLLEQLLDAPEQVVIQRAVRIEKEVRIHVVEGRILEGATFLRFYPKGQYLRQREVDRVERALETYLLSRLPPEMARFSCSCDVLLEPDGGLSIIDLNAGLESGYYFPEEDIFTTNLLAARFTGQSTWFLDEFAKAVQPGAQRAPRIRSLLDWMAPIMTGDVHEAFWDRVLAVVARDVALRPTRETYDAAVAELAAAGLERENIFQQFEAWALDTYPDLSGKDVAFDPATITTRRLA